MPSLRAHFNRLVREHWQRFQQEAGFRAQKQPRRGIGCNITIPRFWVDTELSAWQQATIVYKQPRLLPLLAKFILSRRRPFDVARFQVRAADLFATRPEVIPEMLFTFAVIFDAPLLADPALTLLALQLENGRWHLPAPKGGTQCPAPPQKQRLSRK